MNKVKNNIMKKNPLLKASQDALDMAFYLNHPTTINILKSINKKPRSIKQISEIVKIDYKNTYEHIKKLEKYGLVEKKLISAKNSEISIKKGGAEKLLDNMKSHFDTAFEKTYKS